MWYSKYTTIVTTYSQIDFNLMASCEKKSDFKYKNWLLLLYFILLYYLL